MSRKKLLIFSCLLFFLFFLSRLAVPELKAQGILPFGGKITLVTYCCNGVMITVGPPRPGNFLFAPGSILHAYYNIYTPGPWVLGLASPGGVCEVPVGVPWPPYVICVPAAADGTIIRVGTSGL